MVSVLLLGLANYQNMQKRDTMPRVVAHVAMTLMHSGGSSCCKIGHLPASVQLNGAPCPRDTAPTIEPVTTSQFI